MKKAARTMNDNVRRMRPEEPTMAVFDRSKAVLAAPDFDGEREETGFCCLSI